MGANWADAAQRPRGDLILGAYYHRQFWQAPEVSRPPAPARRHRRTGRSGELPVSACGPVRLAHRVRMGQILPAAVEPMLATAGELPLGRPGWAFEIKWAPDGLRPLRLLHP